MQSGYKIYYHEFDESRRRSYEDANILRRDCFLMSLVDERKEATGLLNWHIQCPNDADEYQVAVRDHVQQTIEDIAGCKRFYWELLDYLWYGRFAQQVKWRWEHRSLAGGPGIKTLTVDKFEPVNGDKIRYQTDGTPYLTVYGAQELPKAEEILVTPVGSRGVLLKGSWRQRFVIATADREDADFYNLERGEAIHGVGIRDKIWWMNFMRTERMATLSNIIDEFMPITVYYYEEGNAAAKTAAEHAAKHHTSGKMVITLPTARGTGRHTGGVERVDMPASAADVIQKIVEAMEGKLERYIVGQDKSGGSSGKGSGLGNEADSEFKQTTKQNRTMRDADRLEEALTGDAANPGLVWMIQKWTFPDTLPEMGRENGFRLKWKFNVNATDKSRLEAMQIALDAGVAVKADELRQFAGASKPGPTDEVVQGQQKQPGMPVEASTAPGGGAVEQSMPFSRNGNGVIHYAKGDNYASTQLDLDGEIKDRILAMVQAIPDADLAGKGRETNPHVTLLYGLHTDDPAKVAKIVHGFGPVHVTLGNTAVFPARQASAGKDGVPMDVIKINVESPDLERLNAMIAEALPHTSTHSGYRPHITLAYIKAGRGIKYTRRQEFAGEKILFKVLTFSDHEREKTTIPLSKDVTPKLPYAATVSPETVGVNRIASLAYMTDEQGHEHAPSGSPEGGQFVALSTGLNASGEQTHALVPAAKPKHHMTRAEYSHHADSKRSKQMTDRFEAAKKAVASIDPRIQHRGHPLSILAASETGPGQPKELERLAGDKRSPAKQAAAKVLLEYNAARKELQAFEKMQYSDHHAAIIKALQKGQPIPEEVAREFVGYLQTIYGPSGQMPPEQMKWLMSLAREGDTINYDREPLPEGGEWRTVGAKDHKGGSRVYIVDGKIYRGAKSLEGKSIPALEDKVGPEPVHPGENATKEQLQAHKKAVTNHKTWQNKFAERNRMAAEATKLGIAPEHLHQLAGEIVAHDRAFVDYKKDLLHDARKSLEHFGVDIRGKGHDKRAGGYEDEIPHLDEVAPELAKRFPDLFKGGGYDPDAHYHQVSPEDAMEQLFEMIKEGEPSYISEEQAYREATEILEKHVEADRAAKKGERQRKKARELEPVPFSREPDHLLLYEQMFNESEHPRGQPKNKGEFAPKGGSGGNGTARKEAKPGSANPVAKPATAEQPIRKETRQHVANWLGKSNLSNEKKGQYAQAAAAVLDEMSETALARFKANVRVMNFAESTQGVTDHFETFAPGALTPTMRKGGIGGFYAIRGNAGQEFGIMSLDGGFEAAGHSAKSVYAHEFMHAVDGPNLEISTSEDWGAAWQEEIKGPNYISNYAGTNSTEGLGEFGRMMWASRGQDVSPEEHRKAMLLFFPKCMAVLAQHGVI